MGHDSIPYVVQQKATRLFGQAIGRAGSKVHRNRMRNTRSNLTNYIPKRRHNVAVYMAAGQA